MYARLVTVHVQPNKLTEFPITFSELILPDISRERGFKGIYVLRGASENKIVALVLWETEADAQGSIDGYMQQRLPQMQTIFEGQPTAETLEVILRA